MAIDINGAKWAIKANETLATTTAVEGGSRSWVLMSSCPRNYIKITYINSRAHLTAI